MPDFDWDHNAYYHPLLLRQLPRRCGHVLDAGCGAGTLAGKLAARAESVDALDRSPVMVEAARRSVPANVTCRKADVMTTPLPAEHYDAITSVSVLHHLPLEEALKRFAAALRPGGVLAAVALPRVEVPRELPAELVAVPAHLLIGLLSTRYRRKETHDAMPIAEPELTVREVRRCAAAVLPGVRVRRLLFWRYLLVWTKPASLSGLRTM